MCDLFWKGYIAGFVDGEGCMTLTRNKRLNHYLPKIRISNTEREPLVKIIKILGYGILYTRTHRDRGLNGTYYEISIHRLADIEKFCREFRNVVILKRRHLKLLAKFVRNRRIKRKQFPCSRSRPYGEEDLHIYEEFKTINMKGGGR